MIVESFALSESETYDRDTSEDGTHNEKNREESEHKWVVEIEPLLT